MIHDSLREPLSVGFLGQELTAAAPWHFSAVSSAYEVVSIIHSHYIIVEQNSQLVWNIGVASSF